MMKRHLNGMHENGEVHCYDDEGNEIICPLCEDEKEVKR